MKLKTAILFLSYFILSSVTLFAQPGSTPGLPGGDPNVDDVAPIDDHLWIIIVLGLGLGVYHVLTKKSNSSK